MTPNTNETHMQQLHRDPRLIYDVGMYDGTDTDFYLRKGFRVVRSRRTRNSHCVRGDGSRMQSRAVS